MRTAALTFSLLLVSSSAFAQATDSAALVREGIALTRQGHDDQALERFRRAYELDRRPIALGQMGLAEQALGQWVNAEQHVREVLAMRGDPWVERYRADLERAYAIIQQHVGTLDVSGGPAGVHVFVNGAEIGTLPLAQPVRLETGSLSLEGRLDGHYPVTRSVAIVGGQVARERLDLHPRPAEDHSASPRGSVAAAGRYWLPGAAVAAGGGVVLVVGVVLVAVGWSASSSTASCNTAMTPWTCSSMDRVREINAGADEVTAGYVLAGIGAVAAAGGAVWGLMSSRAAARRGGVRFVPGIASMSVEWRF